MHVMLMQEAVEEVKEKVVEMAGVMESLQLSVSLVQRHCRRLHETVKEVTHSLHYCIIF